METVQQSVVHLEHGGMPPQPPMAYTQRTPALHRASQPGDGSPYKPQRQSAAPSSASPLSPGSGRPGAAGYPSYSPREATMRYVQSVQSQYGGPVAYRDSPYSVARNPVVERQQQQQAQQQQQQQQQQVQQQQAQQQQQQAQQQQQQQQQQQSQHQQPVEYVRNEGLPSQSRHRISLRPPPAPEYLATLPCTRIQQAEQYRDGVGPALVSTVGAGQLEFGPPLKKIRFSEPKPDVQQPLRIDTREQPAYNPQVEAISPTLPPESLQEDAAFRATKDDLLQQISKVDREIAKAESQISKLKKKQQELEEAANKPSTMKEEEETTQPKHQCPAQKIYAENRKKAQEAHSLLDKLGPKVELPLYNQPSDTAVYHDNKRRHLTFKRRLMEYFKRKHGERESRDKYLTATYSKLMQEWLRKVEKVEASQKRKAKEAKNREFFEKVFPELRKQREDRERFNRVGARIKSEADLEEIMDGLQEQEMEDKKMRSYAVVPPILLDAQQRRVTYMNNNGRIEDFTGEYKERQLLNVWTAAEHDIFKEKYLQHPKNFGVVKTYLDRKSVCDCVQHYYLSKKTENYKQLLRKSRQRTRASRNNPHGKPSNASQNNLADVLSGPTGVTTRLQREQQQKQEQPNSSATNGNSSVSATCTSTTVTMTTMSTSNSTSTNTSSTTSSTVTSSSSATSTTSSVSTVSTASEQSQPSTTITTTTSTTVTTANSISSVSVTRVAPSTIASSVFTVSVTSLSPVSSVSTTASVNVVSSSSVSNSNNNNNNNNLTPPKDQHLLNDKDGVDKENKNNSEGKIENKKKEKRKEDKKKNKEELETSDDECVDTQEKGGAHPCIVCKTQLEQFLQSRPLPRSHAPQYGLREDEVTPGARVCNTCRCKSVRSRYTQCPLPTCPNTKGRVKRLRSLPGKWTELPAEIKDPIISEFQIPTQVSKCCSACFNRISRRLAPHLQDSGSAQGEDGDHSSAQQLRWTEEETEAAKRAIREHGTNWAKVAEKVGSNKTQHQCKNFYFNYRKKLGLDTLVQEYNKNHLGEERKPTVTDEEESGSSTSSCDELTAGGIPRDNSDTDSAASPGTREQTDDKVNAAGAVDGKHGERDLANNGSNSSNGPGSVGNLRTLESGEGRTQGQQGQTSQINASVKEDYDSSATETADEGQGGAEGDSRQSPKNISGNIAYPPPSTSNTTVTVSQSHSSHQGEQVNGPSSPMSVRSVKELMLGVIEMQIKKNPCGQVNTGVNVVTSEGTPTISSILKTDHRTDMLRSSTDITFVREYRPDTKQQQALRVQLPQETSIAALTAVNSHHHGNSNSGGSSLQPMHGGSGAAIIQHVPQMQATITPCSTTANDMPREGLVVVQVQQVQRERSGERNDRNERSEPEGVTLDLSIKKPRECSPSPMVPVVRDSSPMGPRGDSPLFPHVPPPHRDSPSLTPHASLHTIPPPAHKSISSHHPPPPPHSVTVYRTDGGYYPHQVVVSTEQLRSVSNSPSVFVSAVLPHSDRGGGAPPSHLVMNQQPPSSRSGPQGTNAKQKVPSLPPKLSPKLPPVGTKTGSITHGTPVSSSASLMVGGSASLHQLQQQQPRYEGLLRQMTPPQQQGKEGSTLSGSITQGTPVHHTPHHLTPDKRSDRSGLPLVAQGQAPVYDFYKRLSPAAVAQNVASNSSGPAGGGGQSGYSPYQRDANVPQTTSAGGFTSPYPHQSTRPSPSYGIEQQRHIIMSDYITSQKMPAPRRGSSGSNPPPSEKSQQDSPSPRGISSSPHYYPPGSAPAVYLAADGRISRSSSANSGGMEQSQTPPHHTPPPPVRQGVIHSTPRHNAVPNRPPSSGNGNNPKPPSPATSPHQRLHHLTPHHPQHHPHHYPPPPGHPPPGHEAFSSLVDVAVQQPSLPVPHKDSDKRQQSQHLLPPHHPHHHEGLGKTMADSLNSTARMLADHQMQERERFATRDQREREVHHSAEQQRFTARDSHSEQQRFPTHHPEHYSQSSRERDQERFAARERESHQIQQQRELQQQQQQQQQLHLQQQIQQQQQQSRLTTEFDQRQQRHRHQQQQMSYHGAAYRDHRVSEIESTRMMMGNFQRDGPSSGQPQSSSRLHAAPQQSQQSQHGSEGGREREGVSRGVGGARTTTSGSGETMTAASLIHAIITHQINQSSNDSLGGGNQSGTSSGNTPRPGDRLFQSFHREQQPPSQQQQQQQQQQGSSQPPSSLHVPESNGKVSPLKSSHSPSVVHLDHEGAANSQISDSSNKAITLGEHIDSIISKDFSGNNAPPGGGYGQQPHHRGMYASAPHHPYHMAPPAPTSDMMAHEHNSWKLRRALQHKEMEREREKSAASSRSSTPSMQADERQIIRIAQPASPRGNTPAGSKAAQYHVEPVSPPESSGGGSSSGGSASGTGHHWLPGGGRGSSAGNDAMPFLTPRRFYQPEPGSTGKSLSPFDYVKNKIVEVMRTSEDEKSDQSQQQAQQQRHQPQQHFVGGKQQSRSSVTDAHGEDKSASQFSVSGGGPEHQQRINDEESRHQNQRQDSEMHHRSDAVKVVDRRTDDEGRGRCDSPGDMVIDESTAVNQQSSGTGDGSGLNKLEPHTTGSKVPSPNSLDARVVGGFPRSSPSPANNPATPTFSVTAPATTAPSSVAPAFVPTYPFSALGVLSAARSPTPGQSSNQTPSSQPVSSASGTSGMAQQSKQTSCGGPGQIQSSAPPPSSPADAPSRSTEPAPLLSSQYEPLSDED